MSKYEPSENNIKAFMQKLVKIIDQRVEAVLTKKKTLLESPAQVQQVAANKLSATVQMMGDSAITITLANKSGEGLIIGDIVYVEWRGTLSTNTAYIGRKAGATVPLLLQQIQDLESRISALENA